MKKIYLFLFICFVSKISFGQVNPTLVDIPAHIFVNDGATDFENILKKDESIKEKVKILHSYNELSHDYSVQTNNFDEYWDKFESQWSWIKLKENKAPLLLFQGLKKIDDEREYVEIFDVEKRRNKRTLFSKIGKLLAYKTHPRTNELIIYVHRYPCCESASHNVYRVRQLEDELKVNDRFFVGRDAGDMKGQFFPNHADFSADYKKLDQKTELRWSPEIIDNGAFLPRTESNLMIHYNKGAIYKVLYEEGNWQFVVFFSGIAEEQSSVLNYTNFKHKAVYGWIKVYNSN